MTIGRNNSRRRRVILEEVVQSALDFPAGSEETATNLVVESNRDYSVAATRRGQWKTTDLIPKRLRSILLISMTTIFMLVVLNFLAIRAPQWRSSLPSEAMNTLALSGVGSVSSWFSSFLFLLTSMASLQIYAMRRHRCDDYNGTYRIWLWMTLLFAVASIHCVVDFRWVAKWVTQSFGISGGRSLLFLLAIKFVAMTALIIRGILEIRASRGALVAVAIVWIAYSSAIVMQIPWSQNFLVSNDSMVLGNLNLVGTVAAFWVTIVYARYVYFHANGLLVIDEKPAAKAAAPLGAKVAASEGSTKKRTKSKPKSAPSPAPQLPLESTPADPEDQDSDTNREEILNLEQQGDLSKSDRRRLKKLQRRQRKAA